MTDTRVEMQDGDGRWVDITRHVDDVKIGGDFKLDGGPVDLIVKSASEPIEFDAGHVPASFPCATCRGPVRVVAAQQQADGSIALTYIAHVACHLRPRRPVRAGQRRLSREERPSRGMRRHIRRMKARGAYRG